MDGLPSLSVEMRRGAEAVPLEAISTSKMSALSSVSPARLSFVVKKTREPSAVMPSKRTPSGTPGASFTESELPAMCM